MKTASAVTMLFAPLLTSFVLIEKAGPKLNVSVDQPIATFYWSTSNATPTITDKDKIKDGMYASYSDAELTPILIEEAMAQWNEVRGSYLRLEMQSVSGELPLSKSDNTHNIVVKKCDSASIAAYAAPSPLVDSANKEHGGIIGDCDIVICDNKFNAKFLTSTLTHELGHCVGLGHPHSNYNAIMSYSRTVDSYRLDADDKAGAIYLYPDPRYADETSRDIIGCGTVNSGKGGRPGAATIPLILSLPLWALAARRLRKRE